MGVLQSVESVLLGIGRDNRTQANFGLEWGPCPISALRSKGLVKLESHCAKARLSLRFCARG
jgi:hypothetical protein